MCFVKETKTNADKYLKLCLLSRRVTIARYLPSPLSSPLPPQRHSLFSLDGRTLSPARRPKKTLQRCSSGSRRGETCDTRSGGPSQVCQAPEHAAVSTWRQSAENPARRLSGECRRDAGALRDRMLLVLMWFGRDLEKLAVLIQRVINLVHTQTGTKRRAWSCLAVWSRSGNVRKGRKGGLSALQRIKNWAD